MIVYFPATEEAYYSYILQYDSIDIEMYPVEKNISVEDTESFRFDITNSKYDKAVYEQVILNDIPYGVVILFKNDEISRIVYGFPNAI